MWQRGFKEGICGKKGQFLTGSVNNIQAADNFLLDRDRSLRQRSGLRDLGITTLDTDNYLSFTHGGNEYHVVYDSLLKHDYALHKDIPSSDVEDYYSYIDNPARDVVFESDTSDTGVLTYSNFYGYIASLNVEDLNTEDKVNNIVLPTAAQFLGLDEQQVSVTWNNEFNNSVDRWIRRPVLLSRNTNQEDIDKITKHTRRSSATYRYI